MCINDFRTYINTDTTFSAISHPQRANTASSNISLYGPMASPWTVSPPQGQFSPSQFEANPDNALFNSFGLHELLPSLSNYTWTGSCSWLSAAASITFKDAPNLLHDGVGVFVRAGDSASMQTKLFYVSNSYANGTQFTLPPYVGVTFDGGLGGGNSAKLKAANFAAACTGSYGLPGLISCSISSSVVVDDTVVLNQTFPGLHGNTCFEFIEEESFKGSATFSRGSDCFEGGNQPGCQCTWADVEESVQTLDKLNNCVEMNYFFMGSGSYSCSLAGSGSVPVDHGHPTWKIETMDGAVHYVTRDQQFLVWDGGGTQQNHWESAENLIPMTYGFSAGLSGSLPCDGAWGFGWDCATKLVTWQNDVYGFVRVKLSYDDPYPWANKVNNLFGSAGACDGDCIPDNGKAVHWMTTGTNSYQLGNRIVVQGWQGEMCSCSPDTNIDDIPCGSTKSCCIETTPPPLPLTASSLGYSQIMSTQTSSAFSILSWSISPHTESTDYTVNWEYPYMGDNNEPDKRTVTMSLVASNDSNYQVCLTEWAPFEQICEPRPETLLPKCPSCGDTEWGLSVRYGLVPATMSLTSYDDQRSFGGWTETLPTTGNPGYYDDLFGDYTNGAGSGSHWTILFLSQSSPTSVTTESYYFHRYQVMAGSATASNAYAITFESHSSNDPEREMSGYMKRTFSTTSFFYKDSAGPGTRWAESLAYSINSSWPNKTDFPAFPTANYNALANGYPLGFGYPSHSTGGQHTEFITLKTTGCHNYWELTPLGNEGLPYLPYKMTYTPFPDFRTDIGTYIFNESASYGGDEVNFPFFPTSESYINSGTFCAKNDCCFDLIINKQPSWNESESVCQDVPGMNINITQVFNVINYDEIFWTGPGGSDLQGVMSAHGEIKYDPFTGLEIPADQYFYINNDCLISGTASFCFTATVSNSLCWNDASCGYSSSLTAPTTSYTPDCCTDISGCSTVYLNPGVWAGPDQLTCLPSWSVVGSLQVQQPLGAPWPNQGAPTWSVPSGPGYIGLATPNAFDTTAYVGIGAPPPGTGIYTMSLTVPHGPPGEPIPCQYTDTCYIEVVEQPSSILPALAECVNIYSDYRIYITGSQPSPCGYGYWTVIAPSNYTASPQIIIDSPTKYSTAITQPLDTTITYQWTICECFSSSLLSATEDTESPIPDIICCGSESIDVFITAEPVAPIIVDFDYVSCPSCDMSTASFSTQINPYTTNATWSANFTSWNEAELNGTYIAFSSSIPPFTSGTIINSSSNHYLGIDTPLIATNPASIGNQAVWEQATVPNQITTIYPWESSLLVFSSSNADAYGKNIRIDLMTQGGQGICGQTQSTFIQFPLPVDTNTMHFWSGSGWYDWEDYSVQFDPAQTSSIGMSTMPKYDNIVALCFRSGGVGVGITSTHSTVIGKARLLPSPYLTGSLAPCLSITPNIDPPYINTEDGDPNFVFGAGGIHGATWTPASSSHWAFPWPTSSTGQETPEIIIPTPSGGLANYGIQYEWNAQTIAMYGHTGSGYGIGNYGRAHLTNDIIIDFANQWSGSIYTDQNPFHYMYFSQSGQDYANPTLPPQLMTGSFSDTGTSRSFQQSPLYFPPLRSISSHVFGWPGNTDAHYSNYGQPDTGYKALQNFPHQSNYINSCSVLFQVTASYGTGCSEVWYASQSVMFTINVT